MVTSALATAMTTSVEKWPQSSVLCMLSPGQGYTDFAVIVLGK